MFGSRTGSSCRQHGYHYHVAETGGNKVFGTIELEEVQSYALGNIIDE
jgi:hypothetical protein